MQAPKKVIAVMALAVLAGCLFQSEKQSKRGSVVGNEILAGVLFKQDGKAAAGATVKVISVRYVPNGIQLTVADDTTIVRTVKADSLGRYFLDSLPPGEYNILGELDGEYSYQDSVAVGEKTKSIPPDTLDDPGSLIASVALEPNHDPKTVFVQVLGTNRYTSADTSGKFTLASMAGGEYSVRIMTTLPNYTPQFRSLTIRSGRIDTLQDPIRLGYTGIPVVRGLTARFDTATGSAKLAWQPAQYGFLKEYLIYRNEASSLALPTLPIARVTDTFFTDDLSALAIYPLPGESGSPKKYEYRVRIRNQSDEDGLVFRIALVEAAPAWMVSAAMDFTPVGRTDFKASVNDSVQVALHWRNPGRNGKTLEWREVGGNLPLRAVALQGRQGMDTLAWKAPAAGGEKRLIAVVEDDAGKVWKDTVVVNVVLDPPTAFAGKDTLVTLFDVVKLKGGAVQQFGRIAKWEWDFRNDGSFIATSSGDTTVVSGGIAGIESHVLRVTDDDGNIAMDTMQVTVIQDPPTANAGKDTAVTLSDLVRLKGIGKDGAGSIVKWEWDFGNDGGFVTTSGGDTVVFARSLAGIEEHALRVTDDDGNTALDTMRVTVIQDLPKANAGADTSVTVSDVLRLKGRGSDGMGKIVKLEWDIRSQGIFVATSSGDTSVPARADVGYEYHILRVTDDDGNTALDTLKVTVYDDLPTVSLNVKSRPDSLGAGYQLSATAKDKGQIVKWEWDIGNTGTLVRGSGGDTAFLPSQPAGTNLACKVVVTDDDGHSVSASVTITVSKWAYVGSVPLPGDAAGYFGLVALDGKIYGNGGRFEGSGTYAGATAVYDPATGKWKSLKASAGMIYPRMVTLHGKLYLAAGLPSLGVFEYEPKLDEWLKKRDPPVSFWKVGVAALDGKIYFVADDYSTRLYEYDPLSESWANKAPLPTSLSSPAVAASGGRLYALGNKGGLFEFDPAQNRWTEKSSPPPTNFVQEDAGAVALDGKIYFISRRSMIVYDTALDSWVDKSPLLFATAVQNVAVAGGKIFCLGDGPVLQVYSPADDP